MINKHFDTGNWGSNSSRIEMYTDDDFTKVNQSDMSKEKEVSLFTSPENSFYGKNLKGYKFDVSTRAGSR